VKLIDKSVYLTNTCFRSNVVKMFVLNNFVILDSPEAAEYIVFPGGCDISPALYDQENTHSECHEAQDERELLIYHQYPDRKKLGICRGGQLLNVVSGGSMWQDTDRHERDHYAKDVLHNEVVKVTSLHHQMMKPSADGILLLTANESTFVQGGGEKILKKFKHYDDVEACWYPHTKSLCFQPHPELGHADYFFNLVRQTVDTLEA
jgi:GMP synthase-like glutamine amidotransferase